MKKIFRDKKCNDITATSEIYINQTLFYPLFHRTQQC